MAGNTSWKNYDGYMGAFAFAILGVPALSILAYSQGIDLPYIGTDPVLSHSAFGNAALAATAFAAKRPQMGGAFAISSLVFFLVNNNP